MRIRRLFTKCRLAGHLLGRALSLASVFAFAWLVTGSLVYGLLLIAAMVLKLAPFGTEDEKARAVFHYVAVRVDSLDPLLTVFTLTAAALIVTASALAFRERKRRITNVTQLDQITPQEWLALPYDSRIHTVKLFLQREFPEQFPRYDWPVFVRVEDATESILREWLVKGIGRYAAVPVAMLRGVTVEAEGCRREGYDIKRALELFQKKSGG